MKNSFELYVLVTKNLFLLGLSLRCDSSNMGLLAEPGANLTNVIQKTGSPNSINHHADHGGTGSEKEQRQMPNLFSFCAL